MRTSVFVATLALTLVGASALAAEPEAKSDGEAKSKIEAALSAEPVLCYRLLGLSGLEVPVGQAVELCAGTVDSFKTIKCFREAWGHPDNDGLGLPLGLAVDLCRTIPRE